MKAASTALGNALRTGTALDADIVVIAEWNQNRYSGAVTVKNASGVEDYDSELFPIESIVLPDRPGQGLLKARSGYTESRSTSGYSDAPGKYRFYTADVEDEYKYWTSPAPSDGVGNLANTKPYFTYTNPAWVNKVFIQFDTSIAKPTALTVEVTSDGTNWTTISTNPTVNADGQVVLYRQSNGLWGTTQYLENPQPLMGMRVNVTKINKNSTYMDLIEMSLRLESDLSYFVIDSGSTETMSERSMVVPFGEVSSNEASISLSNIDSRFDNDNQNSLYYGIIDKNVKFTVSLSYDISKFGGTGRESVRYFTMYTDEWNGQDQDTVDVSLKDASKVLQERKPNPIFYQNMTVGEIIWRLCDSVGFNAYNYEPRDDDPSTLVPYFWASGEETVWDTISQLALPLQVAVYFDAYGVMQIRTRNAAYDLTRPIDWTLDEIPVTPAMVSSQGRPANEAGKLPDIEELNHTYDFESNVIDVSYQTTSVSDDNNGYPIMETVWQPEGDLVLRASPLVMSMSDTDIAFKISPSAVAYWPYNGIVQIEGEFIRWTGKLYSYYDSANTARLKFISSDDEKKALDSLNPSLAYKNHFTGTLTCGTIDNRGLWTSYPKAHSVNGSGYLCRYRALSGPVSPWNGGFKFDPSSSKVTLITNRTFGGNSWYVATRGATDDLAPTHYGTRMKFSKSGPFGAAGIAMRVNSNDCGYFFEVVRTAALGTTGRTYTNELCFYVRYTDGSIRRLGPNGGKGIPMAIDYEQWYDIDVYHLNNHDGSYFFSIMFNGMTVMSLTVPAAYTTGLTGGGRYGMFTRGFTAADFEYLYASSYSGAEPLDDEGYFDRISGGYQSSQLSSEWVYNTRTAYRVYKNKRSAYTQRYNSTLIDEFGPIAHEVREFDVEFSKTPVISSRLYSSNDYQVICPEYNASPFGAKFILGNTARTNAIVNGEDTLTYGPDNTLNQTILIYGRTVNQADAKTVTIRNEDAVLRRGEVQVSIESPWIQSESAAKALGDWISKHWSNGNDEISVKIFGNPLFQLGDLVAVNCPSKNMSRTTHKYFVVAVENSYDGGLETTLTLRRAKV